MSGLPEYYASTLDLPFNRACLDSQFVLENPTVDPGGMGYGLLLRGNMLLVEKTPERIKLPYGDGASTRQSTSVVGRANPVD